jgi:hypothetical protein
VIIYPNPNPDMAKLRRVEAMLQHQNQFSMSIDDT